MSSYVVNVNDPTTPTGSQGAKQGAEELRAIKLKLQQIIAGAIISTAAGANPADVQTFIQPDINDRPAITAGGWLPWNFNQQWGGAPMPFHLVDSATGTEFKLDATDAYIDTDTFSNIGAAAGNFYRYQVFTSSKVQSLQAFWLRLYKNGNPIDNVTVQLYSVAAGLPNALVATANVINGKQITSDANGQWYRFSFAALQVLAANTQYIIVVSKSGGVDAANFYNWMTKTTSRYPSNLQGVGTAAFAWTPTNTQSELFICETQTSDQVVQSGGQFTGRIVGSEGNPINRSVAYCKPLREFMPLFHPNGWSIILRGKSWTKDRPLFSAIYGLHHDRIDIRSAAGTGFTVVTAYESDNTITTVTGISDISAASYKDIMIVGRSLNDGGDYIKIYTGVNNVWSLETSSTGLSLIFDPLMLKQGTGWIMGGFQLFSSANYTKLSDMSLIPSADGWTFTTTTATAEANVFAISGGKLNQIKAGMAAGGDGIYLKNALALSNANGWFATHKLRITSQTNTKDLNAATFTIEDGTKQSALRHQEFYTEDGTAAVVAYPQLDLKFNDTTFFSAGKGSDVLHFANGRLIIDGVSQMTTASGNNQIRFGDLSVTANENADVVWDYVGYYNTTNIYPQFTSGELHEFAVFSGDKNALGQAVYNAGAPVSLKTYCGITRNFVNEPVIQIYPINGVTAGPTTVSTTPVVEPDKEVFIVGNTIDVLNGGSMDNNTAANSVFAGIAVDGITYASQISVSAGNNYSEPYHQSVSQRFGYGLHKVSGQFWGNGNTARCTSSPSGAVSRRMVVKSSGL